MPLREPLSSYREFYCFGRAYHDTPSFYLYLPEDQPSYVPDLLSFSGPPVALTDPHVLCEGSLFLDPETKEDRPRSLFKSIRQILTKRFVRSGYCFLSPAVYAGRRDYLFIQRDHSFLAPAWRFNSADQHIPTDIDSWYAAQGKQCSQYRSPDPLFKYFATAEDIRKVLLELETAYQLKYVAIPSNGSRRSQVFHTAEFLMRAETDYNGSMDIYAYEQGHRMTFHLHIPDLRNGKLSVVNKAYETKSPFGDKLYSDFAAKVKSQFQMVSESHYGPFYVSPSLYTRRQHIILSLDDPYFRINEDGTASHVWRKELEELLK